jgi:spermidine synthase
VIAMRDQFRVPPDDERLQVHCLDGAVMVKNLAEPLDALLLDGYSADGIPHSLSTPAFFDRCRDALGEHGMLVTNLSADEHRANTYIQRIRRSFRNVVAVPSDDGGNRVVYATRSAALSTPINELEARAGVILEHSGLDLRTLVKELAARLPASAAATQPTTGPAAISAA